MQKNQLIDLIIAKLDPPGLIIANKSDVKALKEVPKSLINNKFVKTGFSFTSTGKQVNNVYRKELEKLHEDELYSLAQALGNKNLQEFLHLTYPNILKNLKKEFGNG